MHPLFVGATGQERPNRFDKAGITDEQYHTDFARYCIFDAYTSQHTEFINNTKRNKRFYKGDQWFLEEDTEAFFKDDTGQDRNRIKVVQNIIRPMVEQYRGNAIRMQFNARVKSISPMAINRREKKLAKLRFFTDVANQNPAFKEAISKRAPIGNNKAETEQIFQNLYVDDYVVRMNYLLQWVANKNRLSQPIKQVRIAENLGLSGLGVMEMYEHAGDQVFDIVESEEFFFDRSAKSPDLTDAEYMGKCQLMLPSQIYERWGENLTDAQRKGIDAYARQFKREPSVYSLNTNAASGGKVPVYYTYWKDTVKFEYGYVTDEYGYPYLTKINYIEDGEAAPRYTDKDLIPVGQLTPRQKMVLRGKSKTNMYLDVLRRCVFIPKELTATIRDESDKLKHDIALEYGLSPYQETDNLEIANVKFPFKCYTWGYIDGEILSPVDDAINPQRFINRIMSVAENQINNSRGSGTVYDRSAVDPLTGEDEMLRNMNQSKPVGVNAKGRGIQNVIGQYDSTVKQGTMVMFDIVNVMASYVQKTTGVNEALKGESTGSDQLVGVTQLLIQRGSLMQEPFYNAISEILLQCYESIATVGKRIYADNERDLSIQVGDDGVETFKIAKDMKLEDFRCFVKRDNLDEILINAGNSMLLTFKELGMMDDARIANLWQRSTPDDVAAALRQVSKDKSEISRMQVAKSEEEKATMMSLVQQEEEKNRQAALTLEAKEQINQERAQRHDLNMADKKIFGKILEKTIDSQKKSENNFGK